MPKTNTQGGKKKKRAKNGIVENAKLETIDEPGLEYGQIVKVLGNGRFTVSCYSKKDGAIDNTVNDFNLKDRVCIVCGRMRKRVWININDIVIVSLRDFQNDKGDIVHKYTTDETKQLIKLKVIPSIEMINGKKELLEDVDFEISEHDEEVENIEEYGENN
jgi:translation initiation factor 1A